MSGFHTLQAQDPIEQWVIGHNSLLNLYNEYEELSCENIPVLGHVSRGTTGFSNPYTTTGQLLFYTDGIYLYNGKHQQLFNNLSLNSASFSSQSSSVIEHPSNTYSIFTLSNRRQLNACIERTIIESKSHEDSISLNLGLLVKEKLFCGNFGFLASYNLECKGQFLLTYNFDSTSIYAFQITESTFALHQILKTSNIASTSNFLMESYGGIYLSTNTNHGVLVNILFDKIYIFKINECDGILSITNTINNKKDNRVYSACFSASGRFLYTIEAQNNYNLYQYDMSSTNIEDSKTLIDTLSASDLIPELQIGVNNRIYLHSHLGTIHDNVETFALSVIQSPDQKGSLCNFNKNAYPLCTHLDAFSPIPNKTYTIRKKSIPYKRTADTSICIGQLVSLENKDCLDSLYWTANSEITLTPNKSGYYTYKAVFDACTYIDSTYINVHPNYRNDTLIVKLNKGDSYEYQGQILSEEDIYEFNWHTIHGCDSSVQVSLSYIQETNNIKADNIPNIFTPNNDGINDIFLIQIPENSTEQLDGLWIQDRWGNDIYFSLTHFTWNGLNMQNQNLENGVYIYSIRLISSDGDTRWINGDVTLIK